MENELKKVKFVQMRAEGFTYSEISAELKISKPTLVSWSKKLSNEIHNEKELKILELRKEHNLSYERQLKLQSMIFEKVESALLNTNFSDIPADKLLKIGIEISNKTDIKTTLKSSELNLMLIPEQEWSG